LDCEVISIDWISINYNNVKGFGKVGSGQMSTGDGDMAVDDLPTLGLGF
jgi:hypothetical protein